MPWTAANIPDQTGKVAVVTGGNGGLGLETVRELARKGAHVVIGARNLDKAAKAESDVRAEIPGASLEVRKLDLSSLAAVEEFASGVLAAHPIIDMLFNNAGVMATPEWKTEDGFEMQFGTNHLGHFALTARLLPALLAAPDGRIVNTTSTARFAAGEYDLDNPHHLGVYDSWRAYGYSKLANLQFTLELNKRLAAAGSGVKVYAADPGFSDTDLQATSSTNTKGAARSRFFEMTTPIVGQSAARGALPQLRAGTDPAAPGGTLYRPKYVMRGVPVVGKVGARLRKPSDLAKLWEISESDTKIDFDVAKMVAQAS
ncbi:MAG: oxidoreductase [Acidimicrobiia bacterium]|nr:oxidoreductase [Acidimicrobiia bacterium]MDH5373654.1 oxidoreductase [Acidimicrobiia bacterium]MDH5503754.1 oxidoreductase [Acidimicrobiia bacterium]